MKRITSRAGALTGHEFHAALRAWYSASTAETIGEPGKATGRPWVIAVDGGRACHLDADPTRQARWSRLHSVGKYGDDLAWRVRQATLGVRVQVAFGPHQPSEHAFCLAAY